MIPRTFLLLLALPVLLLAGLFMACGETEEQTPATTLLSGTATATPVAGAEMTPTATPTTQATAAPNDSTVAAIPADWKSYTDPFYGFSLKYPPDLEFKDVTGPSRPDGLSKRVVEFRSPTDPKRAFGISVSSNLKKLTLQEWALEFTACLPKTIQQGSLAGRPALFCDAQATEIPEEAVLFEQLDSMFYIPSNLPAPEFEVVIASFEVRL